MENNNSNIIPPHLNAEVYRTDTTGTDTLLYLDYIDIHTDGSVLIGCSELTGRYWNGAVSVHKNVTEAKEQHNKVKKSIYLTNGTADGCFIDSSSKTIMCEDNGTVSVWSLNEEDSWKQWNMEACATEHDDAVMSLGCLVKNKDYVTVGADGNIKVWDINEMIAMRCYNAAHSMPIYGVAVQPESCTCFATAALDEYISIWDDNVEKSVLDLVKNNCGIRCLKWLDSQRILFGDEAGVLNIFDIRSPNSINKLSQFPAAIHKIAVCPESDAVAVCCDNKIVSVYNISDYNNVKLLYQDKQSHNNYVRGVTWDVSDPNTLHSVGWDGEIVTHKIS